MSVWEAYPSDYRSREVRSLLQATAAGECVSVIGLSGAGKSNLLGYLGHRCGRQSGDPSSDALCRFILVDCNRLREPAPAPLWQLARACLGDTGPAEDELAALEKAIGRAIEKDGSLCLLLDRFDVLGSGVSEDGVSEDGVSEGSASEGGTKDRAISIQPAISGNLRALRDAYKYSLAYVTATRRPIDPHSELAELFYSNTLWLGPLSESDARWTVARYAGRKGVAWDESTIQSMILLSWGYPSLLRAVCEAHAAGTGLTHEDLLAHPAIQRRVEEFWSDVPTAEELRKSGLEGQPLLEGGRPHGKRAVQPISTADLTAKEHLLLKYLQSHAGQVCEKDDLIRAVWPEDKISERGIRDDSLAQLVRRLREKIEANPSSPRYIHTAPGRGYRFTE